MHILLIEDEPNDVLIIKEWLDNSHSIQLTETDSVQGAAIVLFSHHFDVILLDLNIADSKGLETFHTINALSPSTPTIILTNNHDQQLAIAAVKAGAQDYLYKADITKNNLLRVINYAIERKQIEETLKDVSANLHLALSAAKVGIWRIDLLVNKVFWDDFLYGLYGVEIGTFSGQLEDALLLIHPDDRESVSQEVKQTIEEKKRYDTEHRIIWPDGTVRIVANRGEVQCDVRGNPIYLTGVCWDITERKKAEQWFHHHQFELANIARIKSMGEVATTLAHEINQPLAAISSFIKGCINRMQLQEFNKEEILNALYAATLQIERAGKIIERVEKFSHQGLLIYETVNINSIIENVCSLIYYDNQTAKPAIEFKLNSFLPLVKLDKIQIQQVLTSLIANSIEAFQLVKIEFPLITIATNFSDGEKLSILVKDNGPGFSAELLERVFEPYFTTKQHSTGIGLSISRTIIEAHGGTIDIELPKEGGVSVTINLPI
ncbi:MAG: Adaptive-response sensory-kinase SasA [Legionellaceae bacterium]